MSKKRGATRPARSAKARGQSRKSALNVVANKHEDPSRERSAALAKLSALGRRRSGADVVDGGPRRSRRPDPAALDALAASRLQRRVRLGDVCGVPRRLHRGVAQGRGRSGSELRQRVLGILAREKDAYAQKKLLEGLRKPEKALLPPEKALQLLSYDVHADAYPVAREIVEHPPNPLAKREALRLLAADAASAPIFEKLVRDKNESVELRQLGAAALHALKPELAAG